MYYNELAHTIIKTDSQKWSTFCKIETQESSQLSPKPRNQQWKSKSRELRELMVGSSSLRAEDQCISISPVHRANSFVFIYFFLFRLDRGRCPPKLDRAICLTQSTNSNVNLIWNIFTDTPRSNVKANTHTCITQSISHIKSTSWEQGFTTVLIIFSLLYLLLTASQPHL